ncbi:MAG: sorbosone dehydrogenase family protein, partial [Chitinophagaceae bacterium]
MKLVWLVFLAALAIGCNSSGGKQTFQAAASEQEALYKKYHLDKIKLPPGFTISVYAEVPNARSMALSPTGILYVGNRAGDKVFAVTNHNKDGKADTLYTLAKNLESPNGVAFKDGSLYIATITSILKLQNIEGQLGNPPAPIVVYNQFPNEAQHGWKFIAFGPDGKLYVGVGENADAVNAQL